MNRQTGDLDACSLRRALSAFGLEGGDVHALGVVGSTNDELQDRAREGARDWALVVAEKQSAGRGRRGRSWTSPPGLNLYLSVLSPRVTEPARWPRIPITAAGAAADALRAEGGRVGLKWPNDLLAPDGRKLGGILVEAAGGGRAVIGIGLNVNGGPEDLVPGGASLRNQFGQELDRGRLAARLVASLRNFWAVLEAEGFASVAADWERRAVWLGREVRVVAEDGDWQGRMAGLDPWGRLRLIGEDGERTLAAGDVSLRRSP